MSTEDHDRWGWGFVVLAWILGYVAAFWLARVVGGVSPELYAGAEWPAVNFSVGFLMVLLCVLPIRDSFIEWVGLHDIARLKTHALTTLVSIIGLFVVRVFIDLSTMARPDLKFQLIFMTSYTGIFTILMIALYEEFLCRGLILCSLLQRMEPRGAIIVNAVIFVVLHFSLNPTTIISVFLGGLYLGWYFVHTRSIYGCVLLHMAFNLGELAVR